MEYFVIVCPLEIYFSEKLPCKGVSNLQEFLRSNYKEGLRDGQYILDLLKLYTSAQGMHGGGNSSHSDDLLMLWWEGVGFLQHSCRVVSFVLSERDSSTAEPSFICWFSAKRAPNIRRRNGIEGFDSVRGLLGSPTSCSYCFWWSSWSSNQRILGLLDWCAC